MKKQKHESKGGFLRAIFNLLKDGGWHSMKEMQEAAPGYKPGTIYTAISMFKRPTYGANTIETNWTDDADGRSFKLYRLVPNGDFLEKKLSRPYNSKVPIEQLPDVEKIQTVRYIPPKGWKIKEVLGRTALIYKKGDRRNLKQIFVTELDTKTV